MSEITPVEAAVAEAISAATARLEELQPFYSEYCKLLSTLRALNAVVSETPAPPAQRRQRVSMTTHILRIMSDGQTRRVAEAAEALSQDPAFAGLGVSVTQISSRMSQLKSEGKLARTLDGYVITDKGREA